MIYKIEQASKPTEENKVGLSSNIYRPLRYFVHKSYFVWNDSGIEYEIRNYCGRNSERTIIRTLHKHKYIYIIAHNTQYNVRAIEILNSPSDR